MDLLSNINWNSVLAAVGIFVAITLVLVVILLVAKRFLVASGQVKIKINDSQEITTDSGKTLLTTLSDNGIHLSSACGGKGSCAQCKVQVP
jgi:Na+-transporting NADH:ubiquinone oxidoreductase subunit F